MQPDINDPLSLTLRPVLLTLILLTAALTAGLSADSTGLAGRSESSEPADSSSESLASQPAPAHADHTGTDKVQVVVYDMAGVMQVHNVSVQDGWNAFNYTLSALENLSIAINSSVDAELGGFISSIFNASATEALGNPLYWSWGLFLLNDTTGAWDYSTNGASFVNLSANESIAWAPTLNGTWLNGSLDAEIEALIEDLAAVAEQALMDALCPNAMHQVTVGANGISFSESDLNARLGDSICFYWQDETMAHNVVQVDGADSTTPKSGGYDSGEPSVNGSYIVILVQSGSQHFICEPHAALGMRLTVTVTDPLAGLDTDVLVDEGVPGFTGVLGSLALLGAALARARRD